MIQPHDFEVIREFDLEIMNIQHQFEIMHPLHTASLAKQLTCVPRVQEVESSFSKSYTALQTVHHPFNIYTGSYVALVL